MRSNILSATFALATLLCSGCNDMPGRPKPGNESLRPQDETNFSKLFAENCAACHGKDGQNGPAIDLANPIYLGLAGDDDLKRWIVSGMPGTQMPAFGHSSGGFLSDRQIDALIGGMRKEWERSGMVSDKNAPSYTAGLQGDAERGKQVYQDFCASCHQAAKNSITDLSYLALVSDQALRTIVLAGRPDLGHPDWRTAAAGHAMTDQDVTDVTAYLGTLRSVAPGQIH